MGQTVTYTATVAVTSPGAGDPTGFVEFLDGGTPIADCGGATGNAVSSSLATCVTTYLSPGTHTITAQYLGDTNFLGSNLSDPLNQVVDQAPRRCPSRPT